MFAADYIVTGVLMVCCELIHLFVIENMLLTKLESVFKGC